MSKPTKKKNSKKTNSKTKKLLIKFGLSAILVFTGCILLFILLVRIGAFGKLPDKAEINQIRHSQATDIISVDNKLLGRYYYQNRTNAKIENIPQNLIDALVATEDVRFYKHNGVDFRSTMRVLIKSILLFDKSAGGGSTLTQQLAKNLYPRKRFGVISMPVAKVKEIMTAKRIEEIYSKDEILELYLNTVSFGENTYGIETAALVYFSKEPSELSIEECALLVGLLKANTSYNPRVHIEASTNRRNTVLNQMARYDYISQETADSLKECPVKLKYHPLNHQEGPAPYFREHLRHELNDILKDLKKEDGTSYNLYSDGLTIFTTINYQLQDYAEEAVQEHLIKLQKLFDKHWAGREPWKKNPNLAQMQIKQSAAYKNAEKQGLSYDECIARMKEKKHRSKVYTPKGSVDSTISSLDSVLLHFKSLQVGMIVMNPFNGDVLCWIGGPNYRHFKYDHVLAERQAGSIFKPIVYATALKKGTSPCTMFANDSVVYEDYDNWTPKNSNRKYGGYYSMKGALANSVNTVSAKIITETGIEECKDLAYDMGITTDLPSVPSLALGTGNIRLYDIAQVYSVFVNGGNKVAPRIIRRIENNRGEVIYSNPAHELTDSVISKRVAQEMIAMMQGTIDRGTARSIRTTWKLTNEMAGKTGTTQDQTDGWFVSMTPTMVMAVWVGGDNPVVRFRTITYGQGGFMALPITARFLNKTFSDPKYAYLKKSSFNIPSEIYDEFDCPDFDEEYQAPVFDLEILKDEGVGEFIRNIFGKKKKKKRKNQPDNQTEGN